MAAQTITLESPITATALIFPVWINLTQAQNVTLVSPVTAEARFADPSPIRVTQTEAPRVHAGTMGMDNSPSKRYVPQFTGPGGKKPGK